MTAALYTIMMALLIASCIAGIIYEMRKES